MSMKFFELLFVAQPWQSYAHEALSRSIELQAVKAFLNQSPSIVLPALENDSLGKENFEMLTTEKSDASNSKADPDPYASLDAFFAALGRSSKKSKL